MSQIPFARRPVAALVLLTVASGCSLFEPDVERLAGTTLFQTDTLATAEVDSVFVPRGPFLTSEAEEAAFRARYRIAAPFPDVDYATSTLVAAVIPLRSDDARVTIRSVELVGDDRARVTYDARGTTRAGGPFRYPLHLVRLPRIDLSRRQIETQGSFPYPAR